MTMTEKNITESGVVLQYKFTGIGIDVVKTLIESNDLYITECDGGLIATRKSNKDFVVFKWFEEQEEYYSNYSVSSLKNGVLKEAKIETRFSGDSVNSLEMGLLEAITNIMSGDK